MSQQPLAPPPPTRDPVADRWFYLLWKRISAAGQILWSQLDFGGSNLTDLETRNHFDLQNVQGGVGTTEQYHLSAAGVEDVANLHGATVLTSAPSTLSDSRQLVVGDGLALTDGGALSTLRVDQVPFLGATISTDGVVGAVPPPLIEDVPVGLEKFLCADGSWKNPALSGNTDHNYLLGVQGGINSGAFEPTAFEVTAFQTGTTEYYHIGKEDYEDLIRERIVLSSAVSASISLNVGTAIATAAGITLTLPKAAGNIVGREWQIINASSGAVWAATTGGDTILLPVSDTTIELSLQGTALNFKCVSTSLWTLV